MATPKKKKAAVKNKKKSVPAKKAKRPAAAKKPVLYAVPKGDWQGRVQPLQDRILLMELEPSKQSAGGIILVSSEETGIARAKVMAVGTGRTNKKGKVRPIGVAVGDVVLVKSHVGTRIVVEKQDAWIVREEDVLGIET